MNEDKQHQIESLLNDSFVRPYLLDENITDIKYNGTSLRLKDKKKGPFIAPVQPTTEQVTQLIRKIADLQGEQFNDTEAILDIQIGNLRVNAIHEAGSPFGTTMSMRVSRPKKAMDSLSELADEEVEQLLRVFVQADISMVISGATGAGKTEAQKMLVGDIDNNKTVSLIEDTMDSHIKTLYPEKDIYSWRILDSDDRTKKITGVLYIKAALRNDSDWIIITETRGAAEAYEIVQAALTGHSMLTTIHTPEAIGIPSRILNMVGQEYKINEIRFGRDIVNSLPIGIHMVMEMNEEGEMERYIREIVEFTDFNENGVVAQTIYKVENVHVSGETYKREVKKNPISENLKKRLQEKKMLHMLPEEFKG
ncbi:ATPase, T2SS/T4P/T4SS family [Peribacillus asahii]|uniref:ATPase, T2SS/T4P/T4SS family n=1 Tax=Peribacillus asahii TaxID=228899 RepID=UPI0020791F96|nr:ATPase, T2SS/T4P/T4SS family [Peribacillus asahii]USK62337.1 CpaF/VirB11 family protein [Peribacillus asahii]